MWELQQLPRTPGTTGGLKSPMTPRTRAFESLGGAEAGHNYYSNVAKAPAGSWYGVGGPGSVTVQPVSPVYEHDEYVGGAKGKGNAASSY